MSGHDLDGWVFIAELQLRIARRADELVRAGVSSTGLKLACWLQAEEEILQPALLKRFTQTVGTAHDREPLSFAAAQPAVQK